jgi:serine/threonine-protein kinase
MGRGFLAGVLAAAVSGAAVWWILRPATPPPPRRMLLALGLPTNHRVGDLTVSADGLFVAYTTDTEGLSQIVVRSLDGGESILLEGTAGAHNPFFSPDGRWLGFFADGKLLKVPTRGGPVQDVCDAPVDSAGGSWSAADRIAFAPLDGRGLLTVDARGGMPETLTRINVAEGETAHGWPHFLPQDAGLVFTIARRDKDPRIAVLTANASVPRLLLPAHGPVQYESSGHLVYSFIGRLFALSFDASTLETRGGPVPITSDVAGSPRGFDALGYATFGSSRDGVVVYLPGSQTEPSNELVWVQRDGSAAAVSPSTGAYETPRLSPAGTHVAMVVRNGPFSRDLWIHDLSTDQRTKLTTEGSQNHSPVWSPDGRDLAWASNRTGLQSIFVQPVEGRGHARLLLGGQDTHNPSSWSRNGTLAYYEVYGSAGRDIWLYVPGGSPRPVVATTANERAPALSPDGEWIAYTSDASGTDEVYVQSIAGGPSSRVSMSGGTEPVWSRDGRELFYRHGDQMMAVPIVGNPSVQPGMATRLFTRNFQRDPGDNLPNYDVAPDGRFLMVRRADTPVDLKVILNWHH